MTTATPATSASTTVPQRPICGIVMPISSIDGCSEAHWTDVHEILGEAIEGAGFEANLVSNADDVGIIQKRIIQNLYENPVVVCDVSGKNPNVMFELGLRLAFDKPTIIVKDDKTSYSFDTSPIEHLEYPRDLRFSKIVDFKDQLSEKIKATHERASTDKNYTTFLKHFGTFSVTKLTTQVVSKEDFILEEIKQLRGMLAPVNLPQGGVRRIVGAARRPDLCLHNCPKETVDNIAELLRKEIGIESIEVQDRHSQNNNHFHIRFAADPKFPADKVSELLQKFPAVRARLTH